MSPPKKMISLPKYTGAEDDVPVDKWLRLFETKASNATWSERDRIDCISEYLEGEAFRWYLTEIFDSEDSWEGIKTSMIARFSAPVNDPFRQFIHCRLKREQRIRHYYEEKTRLGRLAELKDVHIVSGLTDGVPEEIERRLAGMSLATPAKWLAAALQAEDSVQRDASQRLSKQQLVQREPHPMRRWTAGSTRTPRSECRRCASAGLPNQFHWHNECPRREMVSALADDQGNEEGGPKLH